MTNEEIEAELSRAKADGMNRRDRKKYKRELENPGRDSDGRPSWYNEEAHGKWRSRYSDVYSAYMEVLGREPESMQMLSGWGGLSYDRLLGLLSLSDEARSRGVDPADYGNEVVDPETLSGSRREWYDAWQEYHPGETFYSGLWDHLDGIKDVGNINFYRALEEGSVIKDPNNLYVITPRALEQYNSENDNRIVIYGTNAGVPVIAPKDADIEWHNADSFSDDAYSEYVSGAYGGQFGDTEFAMRSTTGNPTSGLMDAARDFAGDLGIGRDLFDAVVAAAVVMNPAFLPVTATFAAPALSRVAGLDDQAFFITDPLGVTSGLAHGSEGMQRNLAGGMDLFNTSDAGRFQTVQGIGQGVVATVAGLATGGLAGVAVGGAIAAGRNANLAAAGMQSWGDAFTNTLISTASSALMVDGGGVGAAFANAANSSVAGMLQTGLATGDWDAALEQGAVSGLSSLASAGFNAALSPGSAGTGALYGAGSGMATAYGAGALLGMEGDELQNSVINSGIQGAIRGGARGAANSELDTPPAGGWRGVRDWATDWELGNTPWGQSRIAGERAQAAREQRELRERFNIRGYREPSSFSIPDDWARDPFEGIGYEPQGNFRLRLGA